MNSSPKALLLLVATNVAGLAALAILALAGFGFPRTRFEEIAAERVNIVSPAGKMVIAISNKEHIATPVVGGKAYSVAVSEGREHMAGVIFFNQDFDEMGGLLFNSFKQENGRIAGIGHFWFNRHSDNQVLALQYKENAAGAQAGLTFHDRLAKGQFNASLDLIDEARTASPARLAKIKKTSAEMSSSGALGGQRVFIGSKNQAAQFLLKDSKRRVRARLIVDANDEVKLEFLHDTGNVTARFPKWRRARRLGRQRSDRGPNQALQRTCFARR